MKLKLVAKTSVEVQMTKTKVKREECYAYATEDGSVKVKFHANPKRAWTYLLVADGTNPAGEKVAGKLINAWTVKGMEAIRTRADGVDLETAMAAATATLEI